MPISSIKEGVCKAIRPEGDYILGGIFMPVDAVEATEQGAANMLGCKYEPSAPAGGKKPTPGQETGRE